MYIIIIVHTSHQYRRQADGKEQDLSMGIRAKNCRGVQNYELPHGTFSQHFSNDSIRLPIESTNKLP